MERLHGRRADERGACRGRGARSRLIRRRDFDVEPLTVARSHADCSMPVMTSLTRSKAIPPGRRATTSTRTARVADAGLFTRIGVRPNEGTMDVGLSVWLPGIGARARRGRQGTEGDGRRRTRRRRRPLRADRAAANLAPHRRHRREGTRPLEPTTNVTRRAHRARPHVRSADPGGRGRRPGQREDGRERGDECQRRQGPPRTGRSVDRMDRGRRRAARARRRARQPGQVVGTAAVGRAEDVALVLDQHRRRHALRRNPHRHRRRRPPSRLGVEPTASTRASRSGR